MALVGGRVDMDAWEHCQSPNHRNNSPQLQPMAAAMGSQAEITNTRYLIFPKGEPIIRLHAAATVASAAVVVAFCWCHFYFFSSCLFFFFWPPERFGNRRHGKEEKLINAYV